MRKIFLLYAALICISLAALVYAWAYDTDGGYNIWEKGTCFDDYGNYTDVCLPDPDIDKSILKEWYPKNETNITLCDYKIINCVKYNATCTDGACLVQNRTF